MAAMLVADWLENKAVMKVAEMLVECKRNQNVQEETDISEKQQQNLTHLQNRI